MKIPPVKGTRDFYPEEMALRNWITDGWKDSSLRNGFVEYDGPIFEYLKMYQQKSGDEIVEQLFNFEDRGGRAMAIRPEITPTLARMVNQKINSLARPIKWFSVPRLCRAERPQKGRLREFFQWNIDIVGVDSVIADAEVIYTSIDYLRSCGLNSSDVNACVSSRRMLAAMLDSIGVPEEKLTEIYSVLDKRSKISDEAFRELLQEKLSDGCMIDSIIRLMDVKSLDELDSIVSLNEEAVAAIDELKELFGILDTMGISDFAKFDIAIVRGLAYYTGVVFEIYDIKGELRAIGGGGRYDNLLKDFGGPSVPATGFGMGDCVLAILLEEKGLLEGKVLTSELDYFIACLDEGLMAKQVELGSILRSKGYKTQFGYKPVKFKKVLKQASDLNAARCIILGQEMIETGNIVVKDMTKGEQENVSFDEFVSSV